MLYFQKTITILLLVVLVTANCSSPKALWKGNYITIETTGKPKEDFKVGEYIVVAYAPVEYGKNYDALYEFAIILNGQQIKLIKLMYYPDWSEWVEARSFYYLEEDINIDYEFVDVYDYEERGLVKNLGGKKTVYLYKVYIEQPTYEEVKKDVTGIFIR